MKRSANGSKPAAKRKRIELPEYHATPSSLDENGDRIWPAPKDQLAFAKSFILEAAKSGRRILIVPDKDTDGLTSGVILYRTLELLGVKRDLINVHLVKKGNAVSSDEERAIITEKNPEYIFVLDQGSRASSPLSERPHKAIVIDHHFALESDHPDGSTLVTACNSPPVATSSLLTYTICSELHPGVEEKCNWLCIMGTHGDLGSTLKWESPFPDMKDAFKRYTKKTLNDAVGAINAPRRTATYDVISAWDALLNASEPSEILRNKRLMSARAEVADEVERVTHTAPKFSGDAKIAVFRITSAAQVHPIIATRWAGHLQSPRLEIVLVANDGYLPGQVNFSCRIPRCARARDPPVNIIESLKAIAESSPTGDLVERLGESFARGHKEASGGIVGKDVFEELMAVMRVGEKPEKTEKQSPKKKADAPKQKNTLTNYFGKAVAG
jgi:single-stranded DNA-specific DHH superfamily exonuclease